MVEVLKSFEGMAGRFPSLVLVAPGLGITALGLFVWLGGLGFRRVLFALLGATAGGIVIFLLVIQNAMIAGVSAFTAALIATLFQRGFAALLLGGLSLAIAFLILARPGLAEHRGTLIAGQDVGRNEQKLTVSESLSVVQTYGLDVADAIRHASGTLLPVHWAILVAVTVGMLTLGALFRSLGVALSCAVLGTAMIFAGLLLLMIFKGSTPIARMGGRPGYYGVVFAGMTLFGTLEQITLCRRAEQEKSKARPGKTRSGGKESKRSWRDR